MNFETCDIIVEEEGQRDVTTGFGAITHTKVNCDYVIEKFWLKTSLCHAHTKISGAAPLKAFY